MVADDRFVLPSERPSERCSEAAEVGGDVGWSCEGVEVIGGGRDRCWVIL